MSFCKWFARKLREEDGAVTIPFVMFVPFMMTLMMGTMEMGMLMSRWVMLDRAVDMTVRELRLGFLPDITENQFRQAICDRSALLPDCMENINIEMRVVSTQTWAPLLGAPVCIDRGQPLPAFNGTLVQGAGDQLMLVRACMKFDPIFDLNAIGLHLPRDGTGAYALISTSAYVNEPRV